MNELLKLEEAADRLGVHVSTFRAWVRSGHVPAYRVGGRFARVDWQEVLRAIRCTAAAGSAHNGADANAFGAQLSSTTPEVTR